jgi:hypothetical protein
MRGVHRQLAECVGRIDAVEGCFLRWWWDEQGAGFGWLGSGSGRPADQWGVEDWRVGERDEVQVRKWDAIRAPVGGRLRVLRGSRSQAHLAGDLEDLGYRLSQSSVCRYEQGLIEAPLSLERLVGWALCCEGLSAPAFHELLELVGLRLPWEASDLAAMDGTLRHARGLPLPDQIVVRRRLLWHLLGLGDTDPEWEL